MQVERLRTPRVDVEFGSGFNVGANRIDLLTGPNGAGKTEILTSLAVAARLPFGADGPYVIWGGESNWGWMPDSQRPRPSRVVAQTFSPFNRFPGPLKAQNSLTSRYADGAEESLGYVVVGLHQHSVVRRLAAQVVEDSLFRISENQEALWGVLAVLREMGFYEEMSVTYSGGANTPWLFSRDPGYVVNRILDEAGDARVGPLGRVAVELKRSGRERLQELLKEALELVGMRAERVRMGVRVSVGLHSSRSAFDYSVLQSLSLLRRLGLASLKSCDLTSPEIGNVNISEMSSGQQQLLCSVFGFASSLVDQSLLLIDEPELSLHPEWQQVYMDYLTASLASFEGCHVIVATHSPLISQRAQNLGAAIVQLDHGLMTSSHAGTSDSVEASLIEIFNTPVSNSSYLASRLFTAVTEGEEGGWKLERSLRDLRKLKAVYHNSRGENKRSSRLIDEALALLGAE